jgi:hypothetical protein
MCKKYLIIVSNLITKLPLILTSVETFILIDVELDSAVSKVKSYGVRFLEEGR